jgi:3-oxoacyl-[acyl-carrier-protein] synthase II
MTSSPGVVVTGLASVSAFGPRRGPISGPAPELQVITRWPTDGVRRAHLVPAFQASEVVPGLKTRRLDRLSIWGLVAANLALQDAGLRPADLPSDRVGVTFGTAFGCVELTEAFMVSIAENGHAKADPAVFPDTLPNLPASHVARHCGFRGPNVTLSRGLMSGEAALLDAFAQLDADEASTVIVIAGDVVSRGVFAWYEEAGRLARGCRHDDAAVGDSSDGDFLPGEGVGAVVLETRQHADGRGARAYASLLGAGLESRDSMESWDDLTDRVRRVAGRPMPLRFVIAGPGVRLTDSDPGVHVVIPHLEVGMFGGGGLVGLSRAFGALEPRGRGLGIVLASGARGQRAAVVLGLAEGPE